MSLSLWGRGYKFWSGQFYFAFVKKWIKDFMSHSLSGKLVLVI